MLLTYEQQMHLVNRGLATLKNDGKYTTFKYARKAMYDYLWYKVPDLLECRGHVYDNHTKQLVQAAPSKSFNYLERGYWKDVPLDTPVEMYKKINGFMACVTIYDGELLVSTTGTTTSDYAMWARELVVQNYDTYKTVLNYYNTCLFEVVVPQDPHIVQEREGLHFLGVREKDTGDFYPMGMGTDSPIRCTLEQALKIAKYDRGEGFMMYRIQADGTYDYNNCCKLKTDYYVGKKKLMRMTVRNVEIMYKNGFETANTLPDMWYDVPRMIVTTVDKNTWLDMSDQQRRVILEDLKGA